MSELQTAANAKAADASRGAVRLLHRLPGPLAIFVIGLSGVIVAIVAAKGLADPDYFWHLTAGKVIASSGVPSTDPFSFTWAGKPWTPHEWLSELLIYGLQGRFGDGGLLAVFGLFSAATLAVMAYVLRRLKLRSLAIVAALLVGVLVMSPYFTVRPQVISWLMLAILISFLIFVRDGSSVRIMAVVPFFILWANFHGLWVVGLGVLFIFVAFTLVGRTPMRTRNARRWSAAAFLGAVLASMVTPAGPAGILYPLRYIDSGDWGLAHILEWQSPNFHDPAHLGLLLLVVVLIWNGGRATPGWLVLLSWIGVVAALVSLRNAPVAAVLAMPTIAMGIDARLADRPTRVRRVPSIRVQLGRRLMELAAAAVVIAAAIIIRPPSLTAGAASYPARGVDRLLHVKPDARVLAEYGWGGYVISRMYERGGRVFVDGRNDMYDQSILEDYSAIRAADAGWEDLVDSYKVEAMLFPPDVPIVKGIATSAGWCEAFRDGKQVLLLRECPAR